MTSSRRNSKGGNTRLHGPASTPPSPLPPPSMRRCAIVISGDPQPASAVQAAYPDEDVAEIGVQRTAYHSGRASANFSCSRLNLSLIRREITAQPRDKGSAATLVQRAMDVIGKK